MYCCKDIQNEHLLNGTEQKTQGKNYLRGACCRSSPKKKNFANVLNLEHKIFRPRKYVPFLYEFVRSAK